MKKRKEFEHILRFIGTTPNITYFSENTYYRTSKIMLLEILEIVLIKNGRTSMSTLLICESLRRTFSAS